MNTRTLYGKALIVIAALTVLASPCGALQSGASGPGSAQQYPSQKESPLRASAGDSLSNVLVSLQHLGLPLLFSTNLVPAELIIEADVSATSQLDLAKAVLEPFGLGVAVRGEFYLVTRRSARAPDEQPTKATRAKTASALKTGDSTLEHVTVTASLYRLFRNVEASAYLVDQSKLELIPTVGEDTLRSLQRLPGIATQGISSQLRVRGSTVDDTNIMINGHRLSQPFHVRDYQSLFSAIDPRIADPIRAYTGGYPVEYGDSLQGLVLIESIKPQEFPVREFGLSVFTTSVLYSDEFGQNSDGHWLVSARKGNLDWVLDAVYGQPRFYDVFLELEDALTERTAYTVNALMSRDEVFLSTESDPTEDETSQSTIDNNNVWFGVDHEWSSSLRSKTTLSYSAIDSNRQAVNQQEGKLDSFVNDKRSSSKLAINHQMRWSLNGRHTLAAGVDYSYQQADYNYLAQATYRDDYLLYRAVEDDIARDLNISLDGEAIGVFVSDTWSPNPLLQISLGARWDKYTYSDRQSDRSLFSPRVGLNYKFDDRSTVSFSLGRYYQSHDINLLQIEDGVTQLNRAQRSDQFIVGLQHNFSDALIIRLEGYRNNMARVMPRYENINDPLALIPEFEPDRTLLVPDSARVKGAELSVNYDNGTPWSGWFNYVWSRAEDRIDGNWRPRSWNQRHSIQTGLNFENDAWAFSVALGAHSGWPTTTLALIENPFDEDPELVQQLYNGGELNTFVSVDLHVARTFVIGSSELRTFFELTNALNRKNACCIDYTPEELNGELILDSAQEYGLPLLPAIGFLWKF